MNGEKSKTDILLDNKLFTKEEIDTIRELMNFNVVDCRRLLLMAEYYNVNPRLLLYRLIRREWKELLTHKSFYEFLKRKKEKRKEGEE